ncbi:MAG: OmpA family protein [Ignavibacteria bacterium]|nr:OmpA family protein [Ignavibacteria bacterium]
MKSFVHFFGHILKFCVFICFILTLGFRPQPTSDSIRKVQEVLTKTEVKTERKPVSLTIRNVDISRFPLVNIVVEAFSASGFPLDTLTVDDVIVTENGLEKQVISVQKISVTERVPADFVFILDVTGSMQRQIDEIKSNISRFVSTLLSRGIDYRIGLILFSDLVEKVYQPTDNVNVFLSWLANVRAFGGGDEKENALEAIKATKDIGWRPSANRVIVLITDAPYHQLGEKGGGFTNETTNSIIQFLITNEIRCFTVSPLKLQEYKLIASKSRGHQFDIDYPFSTILNNFSQQLTNLYAIKYRTDLPAIPDSITIAIFSPERKEIVRRTIPVVELGRKLIIENLLFDFNSAVLPDTVKELEILFQFMKNKPKVSILVEGHTDDKGSHSYNDKLSLLRAESVKTYLVQRGIEPSRISTIGYGKRKPIAPNDSDFGRRLNRRTEIVILSK